MKHLVILLCLMLSPSLYSADAFKVTKGGEIKSIDSDTELKKLAYAFTPEKEALRAVQKSSLPLSLDDKFSETPFLYFFNGLVPKDTKDQRVWSIGGHFLNIVKKGDLVRVNNLYECSSLKLAVEGDHLICRLGRTERRINFDGTSRDNKTTGNICEPQGEKSLSYGNCILKIVKDSLRCEFEIKWPGSEQSLKKYCRSIEIIGDELKCRRQRMRNNETIDLSGRCLTDSSVMNSPGVYDRGRLEGHKVRDTIQIQGKEPPQDTKPK